jgi:hypothetical protein
MFVAKVGGAAELAKHCETAVANIHTWVTRNRVPNGYRLYLSKLFPRLASLYLKD